MFYPIATALWVPAKVPLTRWGAAGGTMLSGSLPIALCSQWTVEDGVEEEYLPAISGEMSEPHTRGLARQTHVELA